MLPSDLANHLPCMRTGPERDMVRTALSARRSGRMASATYSLYAYTGPGSLDQCFGSV